MIRKRRIEKKIYVKTVEQKIRKGKMEKVRMERKVKVANQVKKRYKEK